MISKKNGNYRDEKGVNVGLVICPFTEKIYVFEKENLGYTIQSIYKEFSHPKLESYSDKFGSI